MIRAVAGAGGKTSLIKKLAEEYRARGKKVFVTTSTHMYAEPGVLLTDDAKEIIEVLEREGYVMAGISVGEKITALSKETYLAVCERADEVLVEADGSKHLPLKYPNGTEPVIYENTDEIILVCGLHGLGKPMKEVCHRPELVKEALGISDDTIIEPVHIQQLIRKGYMEPLKKAYPEKGLAIEPNHGGSLYERAVAALLKADMDVTLLKEEWFRTQPKLIICGGGHVSAEIAKMASCLDFYIKILDDREEFACRKRFPSAEEVICDTFDHLENYLEPGAYYCVVTRGHKDDFVCVKTILEHSYQYLGMIGSRKKVETTFENLRKEGISEEQIKTIFAPIGLPIGAVTPGEIAVSILAQIIQVKNTHQTASASQELLEVKEQGTLCIITGKTGSSPRGVGSMMFVGKERIVDSIGGGAVEYEVIKEARTTGQVQIKTYDLNREDSAALGMICGGTNEILMIPV